MLAEHGVDLDAAPRAARMREGLVAYLELHIEQGPVLEREGVPAAAVTGTVGVERHRLRFEGQAAHAGTTPMDMRRDAGLAAAATALAVEDVARRHGGVGTTGALRLEPGVVTAVPGVGRARAWTCATRRPRPLAAMLETCAAAARRGGGAAAARCRRSEIWRIEPIAFDERLVDAAREAAGTRPRARERRPPRRGRDGPPRARRRWCSRPSTGGLSHAKEEDTPEPDLERAIEAYADVALQLIAGESRLAGSTRHAQRAQPAVAGAAQAAAVVERLLDVVERLGGEPLARAARSGSRAGRRRATRRPRGRPPRAAGTTSWGPRKASRGVITSSPQGGGGANGSSRPVLRASRSAPPRTWRSAATSRAPAGRGVLAHAEHRHHHVLARELEVHVVALAQRCAPAS